MLFILPVASTIPVNIIYEIPSTRDEYTNTKREGELLLTEDIYKTVNLFRGDSINADKVYHTGIIVNPIRTVLTGVLVLAVPFYVTVCGFKDYFAPAVKEFYIHILHILVRRTFYLHLCDGSKIAWV